MEMTLKESNVYATARAQREAQLAADQREAERIAAANEAENEQLRKQRLSGLAKARTAQHLEAEEQALKPEYTRRKREWLATHPGKDASDFDSHAWPQLRPLVLAEMQNAAVEASKASLLRQYEYAM